MENEESGLIQCFYKYLCYRLGDLSGICSRIPSNHSQSVFFYSSLKSRCVSVISSTGTWLGTRLQQVPITRCHQIPIESQWHFRLLQSRTQLMSLSPLTSVELSMHSSTQDFAAWISQPFQRLLKNILHKSLPLYHKNSRVFIVYIAPFNSIPSLLSLFLSKTLSIQSEPYCQSQILSATIPILTNIQIKHQSHWKSIFKSRDYILSNTVLVVPLRC